MKTKTKKSSLGKYIAVVLILFYLILDVCYPLLSYKMGIQISDWWIMANIIVPLVEIICCSVIKCIKEGDPTTKAETKAMIELLTQVVAAVSGGTITPCMTSGATSNVEEETYDGEVG